RELRLRGGLAVRRRGRQTCPAQGRPGVPEHPDEAAELQVNITLRVWRQPDSDAAGKMHTYQVSDVSEDMSFLEMLDVLNEQLTVDGEDPIAFDSDCREGICGMCG